MVFTISCFCKNVFQNKLAFEFDEICNATLNNYNEEQLKYALIKYVYYGVSESFSRYYKNQPTNYRSRLETIDYRLIIDIIKQSLSNKGVFIDDMSIDDTIDMYVSALARTQYTPFNNKPSNIKK